MRQETKYTNYINTSDNKQDVACVLSLIEAIFPWKRRILSDITRVVMQSDNTSLYQNAIVSFFIHISSISTGLYVSNYMNT